ncbi:MAG: class I SAM-dependent methyltransferase [Candidatus Babeliales bacterium]
MVVKYGTGAFVLLHIFYSFQTCSASAPLDKISKINLKEATRSLNLAMPSDAEKFYKEADKVDGWFDKRLMFFYLLIDKFQEENGIVGNLGEIGVWQGKSFIPLLQLAKKHECALAVDCFEAYEFNRDNSGGVCNYQGFNNNVKKYCSNHDRLKIEKGDSAKLSPEVYLRKVENGKGFRMFSIDGCHEGDTTLIDMENAYKCLVDGGVIMMDDYFHFCWPGVSEGVNAFMNKNTNCLKPFLIALNKVFFAQPDYAKKYFDKINAAAIPNMRIKKFFNVETLIYDPQA